MSLRLYEEWVQIFENELDIEFLKRAESVKNLNLYAKDFQTNKYKSEIRFLFKKHFLTSLNSTRQVKEADLNSIISKLKSENFSNFERVFKYKPDGIGPGEVLLFLLIDNSELGGGSSAGTDLTVSGKNYEIKAASISSDYFAYNFKVGATFDVTDVVQDLLNVCELVGIKKRNEINITDINMIKSKAPIEWEALEEKYRNVLYENYFKDHEIIFLNNNPSKKFGDVERIKLVKKEDIFLERYTSNVLKPKVNLK